MTMPFEQLRRRRAVPITVVVSPPTQTAAGSLAAWTFGTATVIVTGATPSAYAWDFINAFTGLFAVNSGQGTAVASPKVSGVPSGEGADADFRCTVTINGVPWVVTQHLQYTRS